VELVARKVREETGVRCVFHHHCAGFVETPSEVDRLLALTDPELVGLCFDTGHYTFSGGDAVEAARKYAQRIWHVHFKDHDPASPTNLACMAGTTSSRSRMGSFASWQRQCGFPGCAQGV